MRKNQGFTLLEVIVVVAILGILATMAYNSYLNQVVTSNRTDAKSALNDVSQRLQRCYTTYGAYNNDNCDVYSDLKSGGAIDSSEGLYEITGNVTETLFTLSATPVEPPQTGDTECSGSNKMTLSSTGKRDGGTDCW